MRYAGYMINDFVNGQGVCVSLWMQGCRKQCKNCHNPETWDFDGGYEMPHEIDRVILDAIVKNGIRRNFSVLGGEPLCPENIGFVEHIISVVREAYPDIKIYVWSGYLLEEIKTFGQNILDKIDVLIDGPYDDDKRDITLPLRGSSNQRVLLKGKDF